MKHDGEDHECFFANLDSVIVILFGINTDLFESPTVEGSIFPFIVDIFAADIEQHLKVGIHPN